MSKRKHGGEPLIRGGKSRGEAGEADDGPGRVGTRKRPGNARGAESDDTGISVDEARLLRDGGRNDEAEAAYEAAISKFPDALRIKVEFARFLSSVGAFDRAGDLFASVVEIEPKNRVAWNGRISAVLSSGDKTRALELCRAARRQLPEDPFLAERQATVLNRLGHSKKAARILRDLGQNHPDNPALCFRAGKEFLVMGDETAARRMFDRTLALDPDHKQARIGKIECDAASGKPDEALAECDGALRRFPRDRAFLEAKADLLRRFGREDEEIHLRRILVEMSPENGWFLRNLARSLLTVGRHAEADRLYARSLRIEPRRHDALMGRVNVAEARGDRAAALALLETMPGLTSGDATGASAERSSLAPDVLCRYLDLLSAARKTEKMRDLLDAIERRLSDLNDHQLIRSANAGKRIERVETVSAVVREIAERPVMHQTAALFLVRHALEAGDVRLAESLSVALTGRIPKAAKAEFRVRATQLVRGAAHARSEARVALPSPRGVPEVGVVGQILHASKDRELAYRYMRRALRRWPGAKRIRNLYFGTLLETRRFAEAESLVNEAWKGEAATAIDDDLRVRLLLETGKHEAALKFLETVGDLSDAMMEKRLLAHLELGQMNEVRELVGSELGQSGGGRRASHFRPTHFGVLLTEMEVCDRAVPGGLSKAGKADAERPDLVRNFFYPARLVLDDWLRKTGENPRTEPPSPDRIPRHVFQYWNTPEAPSDVAEIMASWQAAPGLEYTRFDRSEARRFLAERFGPDHELAFRLTRNATEESDFVRLCYLFANGGIYADADDKLIGKPDDLLSEGPGLILVWEPVLHCVANDVICAPPGHAVLGMALDMALRSLLARDNDNTWTKTGPGLMVRAVASYLLETPMDEVRSNLSLVPQWRIKRHVSVHMGCSYKLTRRYWKASGRTGTVSSSLAVLKEIADGTGRRPARNPSVAGVR